MFFDGVCNLCDSIVQFVIKQDKKKLFLFASLQSAAAADAMAYLKSKNDKELASAVLYYKGRYYTKADVTLQTAKLLGGPWLLLLVGYILPRFVRNALYDFVANNRYRWFGKKEECMIPTPELKARFLD